MTERKMSARAIFLFIPFAIIVLSLLFPDVCRNAVADGLIAVRGAILSLYPTLVLSGIIQKEVIAKRKSPIFMTFLLGSVCGFPIGAKLVSDFYRKGQLSKKDATKLLFCSNNAGPVFYVMMIGTALHSVSLGRLLFLFQFIVTFLSYRLLFRKTKEDIKALPAISLSPTQIISQSLTEAANIFLTIASSILFFSFLSELFFLLVPLKNTARAAFHLFLELTGGIQTASALIPQKAFLLSAVGAGWGSLCVHIQTLCALEGTDLSPKSYFLGKIYLASLMLLLAQISTNLLHW